MKERKRSIICLALALLMLLSLPAAAAGMGSGTLILMQNGTPGAIVGGAFTDVPAPYDASNGAIMVPLRFAAEALGAEVSWDAESSLARISYRGIETVYTAGSWACLAGGVSIAIGALPELYRAVLELKFVAGYTNREIARMLGISESAVGTRILRGRAMLKEKLDAEGVSE